MRSVCRRGCLFLLALWAAACAGPRQGLGTVHGVVRDTAGAPIPHTRVAVLDTPLSTLADTLGRYYLDSVPSGRIRLRAAFIGYGSVEQDGTVRPGRVTERDFVLPAPMRCDLDCAPLIVPVVPAPGGGPDHP